MQEELPNMPAREKIAILNDTYADQTEDINNRREMRRETKKQIIAEMRTLKKSEISYIRSGLRYTFRIIPGDSKLQVTHASVKTKND